MKTEEFATSREAKEFLVGKIVAEADREGTPLSDVERKMLYFSETGWTLPGMAEVSDAFDAEYDSGEYEAKIADLIRSFRAQAKTEDQTALDRWNDAVRLLRKEDHYLLVMIAAAGDGVRPRGDRLKLVAVALVLVAAFVAFTLLTTR